MSKQRKSTSKPATSGKSAMSTAKAKGDVKPPASKADAQLQALRSLAWMYSQSRLWGSPRRFEFPLGDKDASELRKEALHSHIDSREKTESAKKRLLATGYDVPDSWLTVRYIGDLGRTDSAATDNKPEMTVITDSGADLPALDAVLREIYVAGLRLEAEIGQTGEWPQIGEMKNATPTDDGSPFCKPLHFRQWNIGDEALRKSATDETEYVVGKVRRKKRNAEGKSDVFGYSEPDAKKLWPEKFITTKTQSSQP